MISSIAACYFPTTVLFIDDNRKYLTNLNMRLNLKKFSPKFCFNASETLNFLQNEYTPNPFTKRCITRPEEHHFDHRNVEIDVSKIREEIYNPLRFTEISVIVIDYAMPGLNGLDFCQQLKTNRNFKKVMLTGEADEGKAIKAFNEGVIDRFIRKDMPNVHEVINNTIIELQQQYFLDLSQIIIDIVLII